MPISPFSDAAQAARVAELDAINGCADLLIHRLFEADNVARPVRTPGIRCPILLDTMRL